MLKLYLDNYRNIIPAYTENEYEQSIIELTSHMQNKSYYLHNRKTVYSGANIQSDLSTKNFNQSFFVDSNFVEGSLRETGLSGSVFRNVLFKKCDLSSTVFYDCYFQNCRFEEISIFSGARFGKSVFIGTTFIHCHISASPFDDAYLENCTIENCLLQSLAVDNCTFKDTRFVNVKFRNMNFDFSIFDNVYFEKTKLPFPTIPYILGGVDYLTNTRDAVYITSQHNVSVGISKMEYLRQLKNLEIFFANSSNYYPLVNIYHATGRGEEARAAIVSGVNTALLGKEFSMVKKYVLQVKHYNLFEIAERKKLIEMIFNVIPALALQSHETDMLNQCIVDIRHILLNESKQCNLQMTISSNIETVEKLVLMLKKIENIITTFDCVDINHSYSIEIRHNSPYDFFVNVFNSPEKIASVLGLLVLALKGSSKIIDKLIEYKKSLIASKKDELELQKLEFELHALKQTLPIDLELKKLELESAVQNAKKTQLEIEKEQIETNSISYTVVNAPKNFFSVSLYDIFE